MFRCLLYLFLVITVSGFSQTVAIDPDFNIGGTGISGGSSAVKKTLIMPNGKILVVGSFTMYSGQPKKNIVLLNADGTIDDTFDAAVASNGVIWDAAVDEQGRIYVVGVFSLYNNIARRCIARVFSDGSLDPTFNPGPHLNNYDFFGQNDVRLYSVVTRSDGKIFVGGDFRYDNYGHSFVCLDSNGNFDTTFTHVGFGTNSTINRMTLQSDGKLLVGGSLFEGAVGYDGITRLNYNGGVDTNFVNNSPVNGLVTSIFPIDNGKILIGGLFRLDPLGGQTVYILARLNPDGTLDDTFEVFPAEYWYSTGNSVHSIVEFDGNYIASGIIPSYGGTVTGNIIRLDASGSLDQTFNLGTGFFNPWSIVYVEMQGSKILASGSFVSYNETTAQSLVRLTFSPLHINRNYNIQDFIVYSLNNILHFEVKGEEVIDCISVTDLSGKIVLSTSKSNKQQIQLPHTLCAGVYIVSIETVSGKLSVRKIII